MGERKHNRLQAWVAFLLIGMLLAASWPAAVQGQGPDAELARFREVRRSEPEAVPLFSESRIESIAPEALHLWQTETIEGGCETTGEHTSLALDERDRPHISYFDRSHRALKYAYFDGMAWRIQTVDHSPQYYVGEYTSLALDENSRPHITYHGGTDLRYAYFGGSAWYTETVDSTGDVGEYTSLALDKDGWPHVSYFDATNYDLKYAYFDGLSWHIETVDSAGDVGWYTSLALDAMGHPHISYFANRNLKYAYFNGETWQFETVDRAEWAGLYSSLALDKDDRPHISYHGGYPDNDLKYAYFDGSSWHIEVVDSTGSVGEYESLALDELGRPHISYLDATNQGLKYAYFDGLSWRIEAVDTGGWAGFWTSLALDTSGQPHISYHVGNLNYDLRYAYFDGATWQIEMVDSAGDTGKYVSMALDVSGRPHMSYYEGGGELKYTHFDGTAWQIERVDQVGFLGEVYTSLALDTFNRPHISYLDWNNGDLKYAHFDGISWHIETVDGLDDVGWYTSLALDTAGRPHISYYDITNYTLKYARFDGTTWQIETVDSGLGWKGGYTSLALDVSGQPRVSYYDWTNQALKYAYFDGGTWRIEVVDTNLGYGGYTSLALDTSGRPHVSYYDWTNHALKYARFDGDAWQVQTVEVSNPGSTSLVLDTSGLPHVSYYGLMRDLRYAYFDGLSWWIETVDNAGLPGQYSSLALDIFGRPRVAYYVSSYCSLKYARGSGSLADWARLTFASYRDRNWEIYAARGDGAYPSRLTANNKIDSRPEFNRGATQIAFYSNRDGNDEIYRMNADGTAQTRLTYTSFGEYQPSWSPDGSRIVYYGYPDTQTNAEIYVMNADGSAQTRLTWDPAWDGHPTWSPDGGRILFVSNRSGGYELWTMAPDGSDLRQLTFGLYDAAYPDWSPDGSRIAFNDDFNGDGWFDLAVLNADGTGLVHPLGASPTNFDRLAPAWAPHGNDLAFAQVQYIYYQGNWYWVDAYIYGLDLSTNSTYLLVGSGYDWWPDWQPTDVWPPTSQMNPLPTWSGSAFPVSWSGSDAGGAGLRSYDVEYRDGEGGVWTTWLWDTPQTTAAFSGQDGHTYYFRCRARDYAFNVEPYPADAEAFTTVDATPPSSAASSPAYASSPAFLVSWSGSDAVSGIASYDVQVRDGNGPWTDWLTGTTETSALFAGEPGHTYYFRCRARDRAGNLEAYPGGDGDTYTHTPLYSLSGYVLGNREQPVALARVEASPPMSNTAYSRSDGAFTLYSHLTGTYALSVTRSGFGALPPMRGVVVPAGETPFFYLPPLDDGVADGGFEAGDLAAWNPAGEIPPTLATPGHTGEWAAVLGGSVPPPVVTPTAPFTASAVLTAAGGLLSTSLALLEVPAGAVSGTAVFTLSGVPTVTGLPEQDVGLHLAWAAALTDGTPLTGTLLPLTLTVRYADGAWQAAQVAGEETLRLWVYDPVSATWTVLTTTLDPVSNTARARTARPGLYALAGAPYAGPWSGRLSQEVALPAGGTLSLLYRVFGAEVPTDTLRVVLAGPTQTLTYTLALTESGWVHRFWDLPSGLGPTATLRLEWLQGGRERLGVVLDEVSLGTAAVGGYAVYLPLVLR